MTGNGIFFFKRDFIYVYSCASLCVCMCVSHVSRVTTEAGDGIIGSCEWPCGCWDSNSDPRQE